MAYKSLSLLSLSLTGVWASTDACLNPDTHGQANKASCCAGSGNGQAVVGDVLYEYTCNSYADRYGASSLDAVNAHDCAALCSEDGDCHASSWQPSPGGGGSCWLSSAGFKLTPDPYKLWVVLVNTNRAGHVVDPQPEPEPEPEHLNCDDDVQTARNQCTAQKNELKQKLDKDCQAKVKTEIVTCQQTAAKKWENDKALLEQKLKAEYEEKLAALTPAVPTSSVMALDAGSGQCEGHEAGSVFTFNGVQYRTFVKMNLGPHWSSTFKKSTSDTSTLQGALELCSQKGDSGCGLIQKCGPVARGHEFVITHRDMGNGDLTTHRSCCLFVRL